MGDLFKKMSLPTATRNNRKKVGKISHLNGIELSIDPPLINDGTRLIGNEPDYLRSRNYLKNRSW